MGRKQIREPRGQTVTARVSDRLYAALETIAEHQQWTLSHTAAVLLEERIRELHPELLRRRDEPLPPGPPEFLNEPGAAQGPGGPAPRRE